MRKSLRSMMKGAPDQKWVLQGERKKSNWQGKRSPYWSWPTRIRILYKLAAVAPTNAFLARFLKTRSCFNGRYCDAWQRAWRETARRFPLPRPRAPLNFFCLKDDFAYPSTNNRAQTQGHFCHFSLFPSPTASSSSLVVVFFGWNLWGDQANDMLPVAENPLSPFPDFFRYDHRPFFVCFFLLWKGLFSRFYSSLFLWELSALGNI